MTLMRIQPVELQRRLLQPEPPLVLDARRSESFRQRPQGINGAVPVLLDEPELRLPDLSRDAAIVVYCLCSGQASSTRVALRLQVAGYRNVEVLDGGLPGWLDQGLPLAQVNTADQQRIAWMPAPVTKLSNTSTLIAESAFLSGETLPVRRDMAVLFVDMVDSTPLLFSRSPEEVLRLVQSFMQIVVDVAVQHCGDVHDFEGDGAMLYFAGAGESVPAAFELRKALKARRQHETNLPQARFALDAGPLVVGYIGTRERRSLAFIGPCVNTAARILKLAPPDGIVATEAVTTHAARTDPDLASQFHALPEKQALKGFDAPVSVFLAPSDSESADESV